MSQQSLPYLSITDYDYQLPDELIARYPLAQRSASRLLYLPTNGAPQDQSFTNLPDLLNAGDLIVFNDTKVMKARLFGQKDTGGRVEVLIERLTNDPDITQGHIHVALCHVRASNPPKLGQKLILADNAMCCEMIGRQENLFILSFDAPILPDLERFGELPIPPYFERHADATDNKRYQTVFHDPDKLASVAAPTASLHFDEQILQRLADKGVQTAFVTLHVGAGTFAPVKTDNLLEHTMHSEYAHLPQATAEKINQTHKAGKQVIAVGTTVTRVLETAYQQTSQNLQPLQTAVKSMQQLNNIESYDLKIAPNLQAWSGDTDIFIYPSFQFGVVDRLLTNFHLPKSTLLMLVSAFAGKANIEQAYQHAISERYRFFSYGDAMLLDKEQPQ